MRAVTAPTGIALVAALLAVVPAAMAQSGQTQSRDGLGSGSPSQSAAPSNSLPAGALNAQTGPQSQPAYSSGPSTTANPGAAFVATTPAPSTGGSPTPPGTLNTTTTSSDGTTTQHPGGPGVGEAPTPPR